MMPPANPLVPSKPGRPALPRINRLLFPDEVASWLGVGQRFVMREARAGRLPCVNPTGSRQGYRFCQEDVWVYIDSCKHHPTQSHNRRRIAREA